MNDKIKIPSLQIQSDALLRASLVVRRISDLVIERKIEEAVNLRQYYKAEIEPTIMDIVRPQKN